MRQGTAFHGAHRHTHTAINWLPIQALRTELLPVTIWKKFRRNRRARFGGLGSVLSVPWKLASFESVCGSSLMAGSISVITARAWEVWVVGVEAGFSVSASMQLGIGRMAVCGLERNSFAGG